MSAKDPFLLILKNGPIHSINDYVGYQLEVLSRKFRGELWVSGSFEADESVGRFRLRVIQESSDKRTRFILRYAKSLLERAKQIDREVSDEKVILTYDPFRNGFLGRRIKSALRWPLIVEVNGAYGNPDNYADSRGLMDAYVKPYVMRSLGRYVIAGADGIRLLYNEQLENFAVAPNGAIIRQYFDAIPIERFSPGEDSPTILHLGYPFKRKGVDLLLQAYSRLRPEFPEWKLILIGHDLGRHIPDPPYGVTVMPGVGNVEAAEWISRCGIFVLASRSEAMGRVLIEAAAAAKPRLAARVDGTYTVVSHESDGLLFECGSVDSLTTSMRRLMSDATLRNQLGTAGRARAIKEFSDVRYLEGVSDLVRSVLSRNT